MVVSFAKNPPKPDDPSIIINTLPSFSTLISIKTPTLTTAFLSQQPHQPNIHTLSASLPTNSFLTCADRSNIATNIIKPVVVDDKVLIGSIQRKSSYQFDDNRTWSTGHSTLFPDNSHPSIVFNPIQTSMCQIDQNVNQNQVDPNSSELPAHLFNDNQYQKHRNHSQTHKSHTYQTSISIQNQTHSVMQSQSHQRDMHSQTKINQNAIQSQMKDHQNQLHNPQRDMLNQRHELQSYRSAIRTQTRLHDKLEQLRILPDSVSNSLPSQSFSFAQKYVLPNSPPVSSYSTTFTPTSGIPMPMPITRRSSVIEGANTPGSVDRKYAWNPLLYGKQSDLNFEIWSDFTSL